MTIAVDLGRKATKQTNKSKDFLLISVVVQSAVCERLKDLLIDS